MQHELFDLGGELCIPGHRAIEAAARAARSSRRSTSSTTACRRSRNSSCRAAARRPPPAISRARSAGARSGAPGRSRARRRSRAEPLQYLNRLSDLLFVLARVLARHESGSEVLWKHERRGGGAPPDLGPRALAARLVESRADVGGPFRDARARPRQQVRRRRGTRCRARPPSSSANRAQYGAGSPASVEKITSGARASTDSRSTGSACAPASANTFSPPQSPRISVIRCGPPTV